MALWRDGFNMLAGAGGACQPILAAAWNDPNQFKIFWRVAGRLKRYLRSRPALRRYALRRPARRALRISRRARQSRGISISKIAPNAGSYPPTANCQPRGGEQLGLFRRPLYLADGLRTEARQAGQRLGAPRWCRKKSLDFMFFRDVVSVVIPKIV